MSVNLIKEHGFSMVQAAVASTAFISYNAETSLITGISATVLGSYGMIQSGNNFLKGRRDIKEVNRCAISTLTTAIGLCQLYFLNQQLNEERQNFEMQSIELKNQKNSLQKLLDQCSQDKTNVR